jgi:hypothetical protein
MPAQAGVAAIAATMLSDKTPVRIVTPLVVLADIPRIPGSLDAIFRLDEACRNKIRPLPTR